MKSVSPTEGSLRPLAPIAIYELVMLVCWLGSPLLGGILGFLLLLGPFAAIYTIILAVRLNREGNHDAMWLAPLLLLPLLLTSWLLIAWLTRGFALQT
jgi:hypothetical protein